MSLQIQAGAALNPKYLGLAAKVEAALNGDPAAQDELDKLLTVPNIIIKVVPQSAPFTTGTAGPILLDLATAPDGRIWDVDLVNLWYKDPFTVAANVTAALYVGQLPVVAPNGSVPASSINHGDLVGVALTFPGSSSFAVRRPVLRNKNHLYALIGGTGLAALATANMYATTLASTVPDTAEALTWL